MSNEDQYHELFNDTEISSEQRQKEMDDWREFIDKIESTDCPYCNTQSLSPISYSEAECVNCNKVIKIKELCQTKSD